MMGFMGDLRPTVSAGRVQGLEAKVTPTGAVSRVYTTHIQ